MLESIVQHVLYGVVTGSILVLGVLGFTMVERLDGFVNISHGQFLAIGAYTMLLFHNKFDLNFYFAAFLAIVCTSIAALLTYRIFFKPILKYSTVTVIITSCGVGIFLNGLLEFFGGPDVHSFDMPIYKIERIWGIGLISIDFFIIIVVGILSMVLINLYLKKTKMGKAFRAMSANRSLAVTKGVNLGSLSTFVWLLAGVSAGIAGILLGVVGNLHPDMGWNHTMVIMSVAVVAGLGNIYGVMIASFIVGLTMDVGILIFPSGYRPALAFVLIIFVLLWKPEGIFSE